MTQVYQGTWVYVNDPGEGCSWSVYLCGSTPSVASWVCIVKVMYEEDAKRICDAHNGVSVESTP